MSAVVVERDGYVHVVGVSRKGQLAIQYSTLICPSNITGGTRSIESIAPLNKKGEFAIGGYQWIKIIKVSLK